MFLELLNEKGVLLADGATGTNFFNAGLEAGYPPELWNAEQPEKVRALHRSFIEAGSDLVLTNTFGGTRHRLKLHHAEDRVHELNKLGAELLKDEIARSGRKVVAAGSVGPTGELLEPLGALTYDGARDAFAEQIAGLKDGGVDVIWIETMSAIDEIKAAQEAADASGLPYAYTGSFDTAGKTMMGLAPGDIGAIKCDKCGTAQAHGANCGVGASDLLMSVLQMTEANPSAVIVAKANCGIPEIRGDEVVYNGTPDLMAEYVRLAIDAGARIIGGCCGTTAAHIAAMRAALDSHTKRGRPTLEEIVTAIGPLNAPPAANDRGAPERGRRERKRRRAG
ncbi:MAG: betaine--homocysteine S-methyltransferase [Pseudomonadota bacterium]